jgi:arylsulfatase A-like enzyme
MTQPNILFLFSDQQRWDTVSCYGQPLGTHFNLTPNLDALAARGTRFEHAYTCQPVCGPARACLQTGRYPADVNCWTNHMMPDPSDMALAPAFKAAGYEVGYIGKWHLASYGQIGGANDFRTSPIPPERRGGYDDYWLASDVLEFTSHGYGGYMFDGLGNKREFPPDRYRPDVLTDWAIEYLQDRSADKPFFLMLSFIEPHHQNDREHFEGPVGSKERYADFDHPPDLEGFGGDWRNELPDYLGCCASLDANVGRIVETLDQLGQLDNTVIVYASDHGCHFRTRNAEYKRSCHDGTIRIPMIAAGPGFDGGGTVGRMASLVDVPPTLLAAGGVDMPAAFQGRALQDALDERRHDWPDEVFLQISEDHMGRALRTHRWKYEVTDPSRRGRQRDSQCYVETHLYDLDNDPHEKRNLVRDASLADVRACLAERLIERMLQAGETEPMILPAS